MTKLERTKLIDRYLSHEMTEEEKMSFERLLSEGDSSSIDVQNLQKEMKLQQEIESAIQERGLREMLQKEEANIKQEKDEYHRRIRRIAIWSLGGSSVMAIAAVCLLLITVVPLANLMYDSSNVYYSQVLDAGELRGCPSDTLNILWSGSVSALQREDWSQANDLALQVMEQSTLPIDGMTDKERLAFYQQAEWMHANYLMHNKRFFKAKRLLKKISSEGGRFSKQAYDLLEQKK